jgi:hypothetical protein
MTKHGDQLGETLNATTNYGSANRALDTWTDSVRVRDILAVQATQGINEGFCDEA